MSSVYIAILVLDEAQVIVLGVVAVGVIAIVDSDVAVVTSGSGCQTGDRGVCRGAVAQPGRMWHYFQEAVGGFKAGRAVVVAVVKMAAVQASLLVMWQGYGM